MDAPKCYSEVVEELLARASTMPLDAGVPDRATFERLDSLDATDLFEVGTVRDADMARACLAGLWLRFNHLDESHAISQAIHTPEGSFWHGIMHRREGDYGNAKYWFRRVGDHPVCEALGGATEVIWLYPDPAPTYVGSGKWNAFAFVDLCEECVAGRSKLVSACQEIQRREWALLFNYCYCRAVGDEN
jgi:hypothetical protein